MDRNGIRPQRRRPELENRDPLEELEERDEEDREEEDEDREDEDDLETDEEREGDELLDGALTEREEEDVLREGAL